jgi:hypothetical protein
MSNSPKRAFGSSPKSRRKEVNLDLSTARQMLPLVKSIVQDIIETQLELNRLHPEQESLDRHRRDLVWAERDRRYRLREEVEAAERRMKAALSELGELGLSVADRNEGRVLFPTRINGRPAVFSWQPGEESVSFWSYEEEELRRPIPSDWTTGSALRLKGKP